MENGYFVFFILLLAIIVFYFGYYFQPTMKENWSNYQTGYFQEIKSGSNPLYFYNRPEYRKPYRYPLKIFSNYLLPHAQYNDTL